MRLECRLLEGYLWPSQHRLVHPRCWWLLSRIASPRADRPRRSRRYCCQAIVVPTDTMLSTRTTTQHHRPPARLPSTEYSYSDTDPVCYSSGAQLSAQRLLQMQSRETEIWLELVFVTWNRFYVIVLPKLGEVRGWVRKGGIAGFFGSQPSFYCHSGYVHFSNHYFQTLWAR